MKRLIPFFFLFLFALPTAQAADTVLSEQTDGTNFLEAMRLGQTGDGYNVHEIFSTTVNNISNVSTLIFWAKKDAGTTCNPFHVSMYSDSNFEAQSSDGTVSLTDSWAEYTLTGFSAVDTGLFPSGLYNLAEIRFNTPTNSSQCSYSVIGSVSPASGHHFVDYDQTGNSMMYTLIGSFGTASLNNSDANVLYGLNVIYPVTTNYPYYTVSAATSSEVFKVAYRLPSDERRADRYLNVWTSDYPDFSVLQLISQDNFETLDPDNSGTVFVPVPVATTTKYYAMEIYDGDASEIKTSLNFVVNGDGSQLTNLRTTDLGFWGNLFRSLFVPSQSSIDGLVATKDELLLKMPFNYYTEAKTILNGISLEATSTPMLTLKYPNGATTTSMAMLDFDRTKDLTGSSSFDLFFDLIKYALWIRFLLYVYHRVVGIFAPHQMQLF